MYVNNNDNGDDDDDDDDDDDNNNNNNNNNYNLRRKMKKITNKNLQTLNITYETSLYRRTKLTIMEPIKKLCRGPIKTGTVIAQYDAWKSKGP